MAYKRRRTSGGTASQRSSSSRSRPRPPSLSRLSSVPRSILQSSPALPTLPRERRVSLRGSGSHSSIFSSRRDQDVVRAELYETEEETQAREDSDAVNEIIMAVDFKDRGTVGCAYYAARDEKLCLMEDIKVAGLDIIDTLKVHIQPTTVLISTRADERLEEHLSKDARGIERGDEASRFQAPACCSLLIPML